MKKLGFALVALCIGLLSHSEIAHAKSKEQRECYKPCLEFQHTKHYPEIQKLCQRLCLICMTDEKNPSCKKHAEKAAACSAKLKASIEPIGKKGAAFLNCLKEVKE